MSDMVLGFIIWAIGGATIVCLGISAFFRKKAVGFWANIKPIEVKDIKGYNRATGMLLVVYGVVFVLLGLPLLSGQNSSLILLSVLGVMIESIAVMAVYSLCIEKKYKKQ